ncbi:AAC(3) family N-acetyltransferase [Streptomyces sp. SP18BB07]|uniref:AAC(3) family N-acetyltransferase n=1 Tax=Streptomyces sp. SP18BB07 TaxID=3002522 RepID=UPI003FCE08D9
MHSALSTVGPVSNGAQTMVSALSDVLGPSRTLVMYTPAPEEAPGRTPASAPYTAPGSGVGVGVGVLAETVRGRPAALRSAHPRSAFTALGALADHITSGHSPDCSLGEESPLGRLEKLGARVLLMGVGFEACTAFPGEAPRPEPLRGPARGHRRAAGLLAVRSGGSRLRGDRGGALRPGRSRPLPPVRPRRRGRVRPGPSLPATTAGKDQGPDPEEPGVGAAPLDHQRDAPPVGINR